MQCWSYWRGSGKFYLHPFPLKDFFDFKRGLLFKLSYQLGVVTFGDGILTSCLVSLASNHYGSCMLTLAWELPLTRYDRAKGPARVIAEANVLANPCFFVILRQTALTPLEYSFYPSLSPPTIPSSLPRSTSPPVSIIQISTPMVVSAWIS
ncbi:unnamed protein product [Tuber aestivum]|uniref:Uncharacterized protein n=1 Tax=Tuber aestivum TaxID=59557 RepID=A0A292PK01_9PEZI|nr:unnamed protein product [Tuber aestivum]